MVGPLFWLRQKPIPTLCVMSPNAIFGQDTPDGNCTALKKTAVMMTDNKVRKIYLVG